MNTNKIAYFLNLQNYLLMEAVTCAGRHQAVDQKEQTWKADLYYSPRAIWQEQCSATVFTAVALGVPRVCELYEGGKVWKVPGK